MTIDFKELLGRVDELERKVAKLEQGAEAGQQAIQTLVSEKLAAFL